MEQNRESGGIKEITKINKKIILGKHGVIIDWKKVFLS